MDVWENENAVEIQDVDECLHSSFEFPQTFRHGCFISQWKLGMELSYERKIALSFMK